MARHWASQGYKMLVGFIIDNSGNWQEKELEEREFKFVTLVLQSFYIQFFLIFFSVFKLNLRKIVTETVV